MNDSRKGAPGDKARVIRLGAKAPDKAAEPFRSTEALAELAGELARFESATQTSGDASTEAHPRVATLAAMRSAAPGKSALSVKRETAPSDEPMAPAVPLPKRPKPS